MEDREIIALYFRRDEHAIEQTERKYGVYCTRIATNVLTSPEDAEECVSDTWHAAWNRIPPELPQSLRAFLGRIVRNLSISRFRANRAAKRCPGMELLLSELEDCVPAPRSMEEEISRKQLAALLNQWLHSLPRDERRLFVLRYWYGEPVQKLAGEWGCTPNAMAQRLLRLRRQLRAMLESKGVVL